jgi:hypothetical protein
MTATAAQLGQLRRMVNEPTQDPYTDDMLVEYIERYPLVDALGYESDEDTWTPTYDLYAAAADILQEKAAGVALKVDFQSDGGSFSLSQQQRALLTLAEQYRAESARQLRSLPA